MSKRTTECHTTACKHVNGKRTESQNNALHKYFELVADALNGGGFSIKKTLEYYRVDLDWDTTSIKNLLWRPIQIALLQKKSTTELKKQQDIDRVYEHVNRFLSNPPFSIHVPFPHDPDKQKETQYITSHESVEYPKETYKEPTI